MQTHQCQSRKHAGHSLVRLLRRRATGGAADPALHSRRGAKSRSGSSAGNYCLNQQAANPKDIQGSIRSAMVRQLCLDDSVDFSVLGNQNVTSLATDLVENRYVLAGLCFGALQVFDLQSNKVASAGKNKTKLHDRTHRKTLSYASLAAIPQAHKNMISAAQWWPVDNGVFITAGCDGMVKLWDANEMRPVWSFNIVGPRGLTAVHDACMSNIAAEHMLIATANQGGVIRLCDPRSGSGTHVLVGHKTAVLSLAWSPTTPFALASGSTDRGVRLWDIRRSGLQACVLALDQNLTEATLDDELWRCSSSSMQSDIQHQEPKHLNKRRRRERLQRDFSGAAANAYKISNEQHVSRAVKTAHSGKVCPVIFVGSPYLKLRVALQHQIIVSPFPHRALHHTRSIGDCTMLLPGRQAPNDCWNRQRDAMLGLATGRNQHPGALC